MAKMNQTRTRNHETKVMNLEISGMSREAAEAQVQKEYAKRDARNKVAKANRAELTDVLSSLGLKRVRGALGGIYYE